jgi:hypothetical protein
MATPKKGLERIVSKARSVGKQAVTGLQKNTRKNTKKIRRNVAAFQEDVVVLLGAPIDKIRELDNKWRIIADFKMAFKGGGNCGLQLVERKKDGRWAIRKHIIPAKWEPETTQISMCRFQTLWYPNICKFIDAYFSDKYYRMYLELCDLGDLNYVLSRNDGKDRLEFPGQFWWYIVESILTVTCFLTYGWSSLEETVMEEREKPGWDPVYHGDFNTFNIFVKSNGPGKYPAIKLADFDNCYGRKDYQERFPPSDRDYASWESVTHKELYTIWSTMAFDIVPRKHLPESDTLHQEFLDLCHRNNRMLLDARGMAKLFLEVKEKNKIVYGSFPKEFLEPQERFKPHLERKRNEEKKRKGGVLKRKRKAEGETKVKGEQPAFDDAEYHPLPSIEEEESDRKDVKRRKNPRSPAKRLDSEPSPTKRKKAN